MKQYKQRSKTPCVYCKSDGHAPNECVQFLKKQKKLNIFRQNGHKFNQPVRDKFYVAKLKKKWPTSNLGLD